MTIEPFLKWPGGKRWLVQRFRELFCTDYNRYIEPFLGGGAVFFHLGPSDAILSDANEELINAYHCIRTNAKEIEAGLRVMQNRHSSRAYYRVRDLVPGDAVQRAVRFIYLNRTCFNGIYRVNKRGEFNVPVGTKTQVEYPEGYLDTIARYLSIATIRVSDFEQTIDLAGEGDFLYADPPYTVMHNNNNFIKYNSSLFSWSDQVRLAAALQRASQRGASILVTNADHLSIRRLYGELGTFTRVSRTSILAADSGSRIQITELAITNFPLVRNENRLADAASCKLRIGAPEE